METIKLIRRFFFMWAKVTVVAATSVGAFVLASLLAVVAIPLFVLLLPIEAIQVMITNITGGEESGQTEHPEVPDEVRQQHRKMRDELIANTHDR